MISSLIGSVASAQQTINYTNGQTVSTAISISGTYNPTTLIISSGSATQSGVISDSGTAGSIIKTGAGALTLSASNSYTGTTTINEGTLSLTGSLSSSSTLVMGGGTFTDSAAATSQTVNGLTLNPGFSTINAATGQTLDLGSIARNPKALVDFNSTTGGAINLSTTGFLGPWAFYGSGATLSYAFASGTSAPISAYTSGTAATVGTLANMTSSTTNYTYGTSGTVTLASSITGNTLQNTGAGVTIANAGNTMTLNGLMSSGTGSVTISGAGHVTFGSTNELDIVTASGESTISSIISGTGAVVVGSTGNGTVGLYGNNTFSGGTTVGSGTLDLGSSTAAGTGTLTIGNGATLANNSGQYHSLANAQVWNGNFTYNAADALYFGGPVLLNASSVTVTVSGSAGSQLIEDGNITGKSDLIFKVNNSSSVLLGPVNFNGSFTNSGTGSGELQIGNIGSNVNGVIENSTNSELQLVGTNTYTGGTTITKGTVIVGQEGSDGNLGNGGVVDNGKLAYYRASSLTESNAITGTGTVELLTPAPVIFIGNNTYTGSTIIYGGATAQVGNGGTSGTLGTGMISGGPGIASQLIFDRSDALSVSNTITGSLSLTQEGGGVLTVTGSNSFVAGTYVTKGTLLISNTTGSALGSGGLTVTGTSSSIGLAGATGTVNTVGNNSIVNGNVLTMTGTGTNNVLTITATGTTTFTNAKLQFNLDTTGDSTELNVGTTSKVLFGSGTTLTLNLLGTGSADIASGTIYVLIAGTTTGQFSDLVKSNGRITSLLYTLTGTSTGGGSNEVVYGQSYLELNNGNIDIVMIVPEPDTWMLLVLGGVVLLVAYLRRRGGAQSWLSGRIRHS